MNIYFYSSTPCIMRYAGEVTINVGNIPTCVEEEDLPCALAEFFPLDATLIQRSCVIHSSFFDDPPPWVDVFYRDKNYAVYIRNFQSSRNSRAYPLSEKHSDYKVELTVDDVLIITYPLGFFTQKLPISMGKETTLTFINGYVVLHDKQCLLIYTTEGKRLFMGQAEVFTLNKDLRITLHLPNHVQTVVTQTYTLKQQGFVLKDSQSVCNVICDERFLLIALAESWLTGADFTPYLSEELLPKAGELTLYLGDAVRVEPCLFAPENANEQNVALCYKQKDNVYRVRVLYATILNGKIDNLFFKD